MVRFNAPLTAKILKPICLKHSGTILLQPYFFRKQIFVPNLAQFWIIPNRHLESVYALLYKCMIRCQLGLFCNKFEKAVNVAFICYYNKNEICFATVDVVIN